MTVEDIKLNSTVFHWPDSLKTVFDVTEDRLASRRERAKNDLKKKVAEFEEKLQEHNKEIETFRKKEVTAHSCPVKDVCSTFCDFSTCRVPFLSLNRQR